MYHKLKLIHGPNLNMLGIREPEIYGKTTYPVLVEMLHIWAKELGIENKFLKIRRDVIRKYFKRMNERQFEGVVTAKGPVGHRNIDSLSLAKLIENAPVILSIRLRHNRRGHVHYGSAVINV